MQIITTLAQRIIDAQWKRDAAKAVQRRTVYNRPWTAAEKAKAKS